MTHSEIHRAVAPLRLVFWGALLCVLDFSFNGFDLLIAELRVDEASYRPRMQ